MEFPGFGVKMTATCNPHHSSIHGLSYFKPDDDFYVTLPELQQVVFDPSARTPPGMCVTAGAHKRLKILEIPCDHDLKAKIRTNSPSGSLFLEDVQYVGSCRQVHSQAVLNYELRANGQASISQECDSHQLFVEFNFEVRCWLTGSMIASSAPCTRVAEPINHRAGASSPLASFDPHARDAGPTNHNAYVSSPRFDEVKPVCREEVAAPSQRAPRSTAQRLSYPSEQALGQLEDTNNDLTDIEIRVEEISSDLPDAYAKDIFVLKAELAQLETKAKQLETKGIDDVYTGELQSGKQMAKHAKKDMLLRFEQLYTRVDDVFALMRAKTAEY